MTEKIEHTISVITCKKASEMYKTAADFDPYMVRQVSSFEALK